MTLTHRAAVSDPFPEDDTGGLPGFAAAPLVGCPRLPSSPPPPHPRIRVQRWSTRRVLLGAASIGGAVGADLL